MHLVNRTFDEIQVGEHAELRRLITPDDLYVFAVASGNFNPMHLPSQDVDGDGKPENIAPAMFVASLVASVLGNLLPGPGTLFKGHRFDVLARAHAGDELLSSVTVLEKRADGTVRLQTQVVRTADSQVIMQGEADVVAPTQKFDRSVCSLPTTE